MTRPRRGRSGAWERDSALIDLTSPYGAYRLPANYTPRLWGGVRAEVSRLRPLFSLPTGLTATLRGVTLPAMGPGAEFRATHPWVHHTKNSAPPPLLSTYS